jgi:hypothetical protein
MKSNQTPTPAAAGPKPFTHSLNRITLEVTIAQPLEDRQTWSSGYAIHNKWIGAETPPRKIPINLSFSGRSFKRAAKMLTTGSRIVVDGSLHFSEGETKDFFSIQVDDFTPCAPPAAKQPTGEPDPS